MEQPIWKINSGRSHVAHWSLSTRKTVVYHDQNRIIAIGWRLVSDEIHGDLLEGMGAFGRDGG